MPKKPGGGGGNNSRARYRLALYPRTPWGNGQAKERPLPGQRWVASLPSPSDCLIARQLK